MPTVAHRAREIRCKINEKFLCEFDFKTGNVLGKTLYLIAAEGKEYYAGEIKPIKIEEVKIPKDRLMILSPYARHAVGHVIAIGEEISMPVEEDRSADYGLFVAGIAGEVKKGELIGVITLIPIEPLK
ncbi:MAG: DUF22 domain-containing protein [Halobacteriota archaeon]|nr:DUF22 domain-containing protein [Halobacteriota archaeon]